jgi:DNA-directed RNA polymerase subunit RPC12/RpoP
MVERFIRCTVCGALIDEEDLFCANCGREAPCLEDREARPAQRTSTYNFGCQGCGASMSYDASAQALRCPFCGSKKLDPQQDVQVLAPKLVVPFQLDRAAALRRMRHWLGRGLWRPANLAASAVVTKIAKVYVPYWVFQANTVTQWTADSDRVPSGARGDWVPMSGAHEATYTGLLIGASSALTPNETAAICPFDLAHGVPAAQLDLDSVTVEQFRVQRKYARPLACAEFQALERNACAACVPGRHRHLKLNVRLENLTSEPVLLPVWIMAYTYQGRLFRFLVNGQTGRATGGAPISWLKLTAVVATAAVILLFMLLQALLAH